MIEDGPPFIIGRDFFLGDRYSVQDMARDCGCGSCVAILEDAARRQATLQSRWGA